MTVFDIGPYNPADDEAVVYEVWLAAIGAHWPISREAFHYKTVGNEAYVPGDHIVARAGGRVVGFAATQARQVPGEAAPRGEVMLVLVDPAQQRRRIGRALQDRALDVLRERGVRSVQLGSGGFAYFWAGVPANLPGAWAFFEACGWRDEERTFDLVADLEEYTTPSGVYERPGSAGVRIHEATSADAPGIRAFAAGCFPHWLRYYEQVLDQGEYGDIVLAKDADGVTAGISYAMDFRTEAGRNDFVWQSLLGRAVGGVGPLGVAESMRGRGIGLALAARVTEMLRVRGLATSFVGYTWLVDWYGKLGYRVWREYRISRKAL